MKRYITSEEMRELQLDMLVKIHDYCTTQGIRYSLGGGTLLGSVRHKGFIPWDDDVDIMMPRPDYDRFVVDFKSEHLVVQTYLNDKRYFKPFAKVYNDRTTLLEYGSKNGVYIDIFPIDGLPEDDGLAEYIKKIQSLSVSVMRATYYHTNKGCRVYIYLKYLIKRALYPKRQASIAKMEQLLHSCPFENSKNAGAITGRYLEKEIMDAETFKSYISLPFEGYNLMCIAAYNKYLMQHYGDYMQLPPKEQQKPNHDFKAWWN